MIHFRFLPQPLSLPELRQYGAISAAFCWNSKGYICKASHMFMICVIAVQTLLSEALQQFCVGLVPFHSGMTEALKWVELGLKLGSALLQREWILLGNDEKA